MSVEKLLKAKDKLVIGKKEVLKSLRDGTISEAFVSQNCPENIFSELSNVANITGASVSKLNLSSEELATQLKKPFNISVAGIKK